MRDLDVPATPAARLRRPSWRDSRLVIGVLIVVSSVVIGTRVMALADTTVPVFAAAAALPSGRVLTAGDVRVARVQLGSATGIYLSARRRLPVGLVLARPIGAGELLPVAALGTTARMTRRPVAIPLPEPVPAGLGAGTSVDVWSSAKETGDGATGYRPPVRIVTAAEVFTVTRGDGGLGAGTGDSVQILLEESELRSVLDALANGAKVAVVPAPGGARAAPPEPSDAAEAPGGAG